MGETAATRRIHVVEMLDATDGGTKTHLLHILRGLDRGRFRLTFIASAERNPAFRREMEQLRAEGIEVFDLPIVRPIRPWRDWPALQRVTAALRELQPDILHTHASKSGVLGRLAAARAGVPRVIHTPHVFYFQGKSGLARIFYRRVERAMLPWTTTLVCLTEEQQRVALEEVGAAAGQAVVLPNGVDAERFAQRGRRGEARRALGLPPDAPVIGAVTRFAPQKRFDLFLEAAALVVREHPKTRLLVVGDGPLRAEMRARARRLGLFERIAWVERTDDPLEAYEAMDAFALSSQYEGLPYTLLEAMSVGLPVAAPRITGCEEVIEHGETGLLVEAGNPGALAAALLRCLREKDWAADLGRAARESVGARYPLSLFLDRLSRLYLSDGD